MADLLELSARIIDEGLRDVVPNRITQELSELGDGLAVIESFSHVVVVRTDAGLVTFDTSGRFTGPMVLASLRRWSDARVDTIVYTHGHVDHVGGAVVLCDEARGRGREAPRVVGHENVARRFDRYQTTEGYNVAVNRRQFDAAADMLPDTFLPPGTPRPDVAVSDALAISVGGLDIELRHARGETDDHLWAWLPGRKTICAGDFFIWNFPNAGNPQKVQRYPSEWARALRTMAAQGAELFVPAHGLPIAGVDRIRGVLEHVARVLEGLVERTVAMMNEGASLDAILAEVKVPREDLETPYLVPRYDEPEFVVRNVWREYGGWWDGNPARLKPPSDAVRARELASLAGGTATLVARARSLADAGEHRMASELIEIAAGAAPEDRDVHGARYAIYRARRKAETSLMAKGIFGSASRESWAIAHPGEPYPHTRAAGYNI